MITRARRSSRCLKDFVFGGLGEASKSHYKKITKETAENGESGKRWLTICAKGADANSDLAIMTKHYVIVVEKKRELM